MLNDLLIIERCLRAAGIATTPLHKDVKSAGRVPTAHIFLKPEGEIAGARLLPVEIKLWTLRDGQKNSFPFVKIASPIWNAASLASETLARLAGDDRAERRKAFESASRVASVSPALESWPDRVLVARIRERVKQLREGVAGPSILAPFERFLAASQVPGFLNRIAQTVVTEVMNQADPEWLELATSLLIGRFDAATSAWDSQSAILFDAYASDIAPIYSGEYQEALSRALAASETGAATPVTGSTCGLTGQSGPLVVGSFPQPNLQIIGQTYLFAKNADTPANSRYGRTAEESMPVAAAIADELAAAVTAVTAPERRLITWRSIPGEVPKQNDLLIAFVPADLTLHLAAELAGRDEDDEEVQTEAIFEEKTKNFIALFEGKDPRSDARDARLMIIRKLDPANRKMIYDGKFSAQTLFAAATDWVLGENNLPDWLRIPVFSKKKKQIIRLRRAHVPPLSMTGFTRRTFLHDGVTTVSIRGLPAEEVLQFFVLDTGMADGNPLPSRVLRSLLNRFQPLIASFGETRIREPGRTSALGGDVTKALALLAIALRKLGRNKEDYLKHPAFRFGQLLAAADVVHKGYCYALRKGDLPPALLGNQVFAMAQHRPVAALAALCARWKPYAAWVGTVKSSEIEAMSAEEKKSATAKKPAADEKSANEPKRSEKGWAVVNALSAARRARSLFSDLEVDLHDLRPDDVFRAELLLGYISGLPSDKDASTGAEK